MESSDYDRAVEVTRAFIQGCGLDSADRDMLTALLDEIDSETLTSIEAELPMNGWAMGQFFGEIAEAVTGVGFGLDSTGSASEGRKVGAILWSAAEHELSFEREVSALVRTGVCKDEDILRLAGSGESKSVAKKTFDEIAFHLQRTQPNLLHIAGHAEELGGLQSLSKILKASNGDALTLVKVVKSECRGLEAVIINSCNSHDPLGRLFAVPTDDNGITWSCTVD